MRELEDVSMSNQLSSGTRFPRRTIVISDLHLGGASPSMMSRPERLAEFLRTLPDVVRADEELELLIAGDFVDFLAVPSYRSWTPNPGEAVEKLRRTMTRTGDHRSAFAPVFDALAELFKVESFARLVVLVGNHDIELTIPQVQNAICRRLDAPPSRVHFVADGSAYRLGGLLVEHGNRYDGANRNDWDGLRAHRSACSRREDSPVDVHVSAGSEVVEKLVSPLKKRYPFIDLLQPGGKELALLLFAFEPELVKQWRAIASVFQAKRRQSADRSGEQPEYTRNVSAWRTAPDDVDEELREAFGSTYEELVSEGTTQDVGALDVAAVTLDGLRRGGLRGRIDEGKLIEADRLVKIRAALRAMVPSPEVYDPNFDDETCACRKAAGRLLGGSDVQTVIMGHTHFARHVGPAARARYINTGTWADIIRIPDEVLADGEEALGALEAFLNGLVNDDVRQQFFSYADVRLGPAGNVKNAALRFVSDDY